MKLIVALSLFNKISHSNRNKILNVRNRLEIHKNKQQKKMSVCLYSGLTSLSTIFQSYHDGVWLRQGAKCSLL